jgi:hypothetical protein
VELHGAGGSLDSGLGELKSRFKDVGWQQPSRLRNRVVHGYRAIDLEILHVTAIDFLPGFIASLRTVLLAIEPTTSPTREPDCVEVQYLPRERDVPTESSDPARRAPVSLGPCLTCPKY